MDLIRQEMASSKSKIEEKLGESLIKDYKFAYLQTYDSSKRA